MFPIHNGLDDGRCQITGADQISEMLTTTTYTHGDLIERSTSFHFLPRREGLRDQLEQYRITRSIGFISDWGDMNAHLFV